MYLNGSGTPPTTETPSRLTLTWDVFKLSSIILFGYNYRWLTLTWDVFKLALIAEFTAVNPGLTLTWDVFKYFRSNYSKLKSFKINFNMRCI